MIKQLKLENFKIFQELKINFTSLTVITGRNGSGKSSIIQAILILLQSSKAYHLLSQQILLNGEYFEGGALSDLKFHFMSSDVIKVAIEIDGHDLIEFNIKVDQNNKADKLVKFSISGLPMDEDDEQKHDIIKLLRIQNRIGDLCRRVSYISTNRMSGGPNYFPLNPLGSKNKSVGISGEYAADVLSSWWNQSIKNEYLSDFLQIEDNCSLSIIVNKLYEHMFDSIPLATRDTQLAYLEFSSSFTPSYRVKSFNTGQGLTSILPIIVSLVMADHDDIIIIENPEAHLHPYAQSLLSMLIVCAVNNGAQVIVETHSDHVINSLRLCALERSGDRNVYQKSLQRPYLTKEKISFFFVSKEMVDNIYMSKVLNVPAVPQRGDFVPPFFFDQAYRDLKEL